MSSDPEGVTGAIQRAEDAFENTGFGRPDFEAGIDRDEDWKTLLTKACRYLEALRTLRARDGFNGAVIELSFGAIERTFEAYLLWATNASIEDFMDHTAVYDRVVEAGLLEAETAESLRRLYGANRTEHYYGGRVPTTRKGSAMTELAEAIHDFTVGQIRTGGTCLC